VAFSPNSRRIVAGGVGRTVSVWDAATGREELTLKGHSDRVMFTGFAPNGQRLVTSGFDDGTTRVWDTASGQELLTLNGHLALALSPDGRRLASGGDPPARLIEIATAEQVAAGEREEQAARERVEAERQQRRAAMRRIREAGIREWLVSGPIPFAGWDGAAALDQPLIPPETLRRPQEGDRVHAGQVEHVWRAVRLEDFRLDFVRLFDSLHEYHAAYAVCYILSETPRSGLVLHVGSDDQARVVLNGREIYRQREGRPWEPAQEQVSGVELRPGVNVLVLNVVNEAGDWLASVSFTDADGQAVPGLRITLDPGTTE
jgi:hypothetical protein